jgi:hypothetical protein
VCVGEELDVEPLLGELEVVAIARVDHAMLAR